MVTELHKAIMTSLEEAVKEAFEPEHDVGLHNIFCEKWAARFIKKVEEKLGYCYEPAVSAQFAAGYNKAVDNVLSFLRGTTQ